MKENGARHAAPQFLPSKWSGALEDRTAHGVATELDQRRHMQEDGERYAEHRH
jgi:hypothetical protein